jgi:hypothetical protein
VRDLKESMDPEIKINIKVYRIVSSLSGINPLDGIAIALSFYQDSTKSSKEQKRWLRKREKIKGVAWDLVLHIAWAEAEI